MTYYHQNHDRFCFQIVSFAFRLTLENSYADVMNSVVLCNKFQHSRDDRTRDRVVLWQKAYVIHVDSAGVPIIELNIDKIVLRGRV